MHLNNSADGDLADSPGLNAVLNCKHNCSFTTGALSEGINEKSDTHKFDLPIKFMDIQTLAPIYRRQFFT